MQLKRNRKKGFSLVEIIVAISILMIATVAIGRVIIGAQNASHESVNATTLQQRADRTGEKLKDIVLQTDVGIVYRCGTGDASSIESSTIDPTDNSSVCFLSYDIESRILTTQFYKYDKDSKCLFYASQDKNVQVSDGSSSTQTFDFDDKEAMADIQNWSLASDHVSSFSLDLSKYDSVGIISYNVEFEDESTDATQKRSESISVRNALQVNQSTFELYVTHVSGITIPKLQQSTFTYDRTEHSVVEENVDDRYVTKTGVFSATNAGSYKITYSLKDKTTMAWKDGSIADKQITWTIKPKQLDCFNWGDVEWIYDGSTHSTTCSPVGVISGDACTVTLTNNAIKNVGQEVVRATALSNPNYSLPRVYSTTLTVVEKTVQLQWGTTEWVYDGKAHSTTCIVKGIQSGDTCTASLSGNSITNAGSTVVKAVGLSNSNYVLPDNSSTTLTVKKAATATASAVSGLAYNGKIQTGVVGSYVTWSGKTTATNASGDLLFNTKDCYIAYATPDNNHTWADGTVNKKEIKWYIDKAVVTVPTLSNTSKTYNGSAQSPTVNNFTANLLTQSGTSSATNAGSYTITWTINDIYNYKWSDKTDSAEKKTATWTIGKAKSASASSSNKTYNGSSQTGVSGSYVSWSGTTSATNAGSYTAYATPDSNHTWSDGMTSKKTISWKINRSATLKIPSLSNTSKTYNGNNQSVTINNSNSSSNVKQAGTGTAKNAGTYTVYWDIQNSNYAWTDGTTGRKSATWSIARQKTASASGSAKAYTGSSITGVSGSSVSWSGTTSATNVGSYTAYATPDSNHAWSNGGTEQRKISWSIYTVAPAVGNMARMNGSDNNWYISAYAGARVGWSHQCSNLKVVADYRNTGSKTRVQAQCLCGDTNYNNQYGFVTYSCLIKK